MNIVGFNPVQLANIDFSARRRRSPHSVIVNHTVGTDGFVLLSRSDSRRDDKDENGGGWIKDIGGGGVS